jgi:hypothetical protein
VQVSKHVLEGMQEGVYMLLWETQTVMMERAQLQTERNRSTKGISAIVRAETSSDCSVRHNKTAAGDRFLPAAQRGD